MSQDVREGSNITHLNIFHSHTIFISWLHYLITFYILNMLHFVCKITFIGCFMVIRVRNQTESRLVIYVKNTLCPGKHRKKQARNIFSHGTHLYSIIGMVRRLPNNWHIFYCVFIEPKLHNSTSKSGHICYAEKLKIAVWDLKLPHWDCHHTK